MSDFWTLRGGGRSDADWGTYASCDSSSPQKTRKRRARCCRCFFILTASSLLWLILTILTTLAVITCIITPQWLIGEARPLPAWQRNFTFSTRRATVGLFNRCTRRHGFSEALSGGASCITFVSSATMSRDTFPYAWRASVALFAVAVVMLLCTCVTALLSLCRRSLVGKSIFTVSGFIQSTAEPIIYGKYMPLGAVLLMSPNEGMALNMIVAATANGIMSNLGLLLIMGLFLYPAGWGSKRVINLCGKGASAFVKQNCDLGWAFYGCMVCTILVFSCAALSVRADKATAKQKIEDKVEMGHHFICVL